jgi:type IV pilus assembly protein PilV
MLRMRGNRSGNTRAHACDLRKQSGVGLIEVLVAVLVLSFGMLGLVGLQLWSLRNNQSALERSMAVMQSHSIVDAMRADRVNAMDHKFDIAIDASVPAGTDFAKTALTSWRANLREALGPNATGAVACDGPRCLITVRWNDERAAEGNDQQEVVTEVQL